MRRDQDQRALISWATVLEDLRCVVPRPLWALEIRLENADISAIVYAPLPKLPAMPQEIVDQFSGSMANHVGGW